MGNVQVTVVKLDVVQVDEELGLIAVRGAIPGPKGGILEQSFRGNSLRTFLYSVSPAFFWWPSSGLVSLRREQFERRIHKRLIDVVKPSPKTVEALMSLELHRQAGFCRARRYTPRTSSLSRPIVGHTPRKLPHF